MLLIEQELTPDTEIDTNGTRVNAKHRMQMPRVGHADSSWVLSGSSGNGGMASGGVNQAWLQLYLAACKLLDLALVLPGDFLPHFQLYRWAFVGDSGCATTDNDRRRLREQLPTFVPHVVRISRRMSARFGEIAHLSWQPQRPMLTSGHIACLDDLCGFFATIHAAIKDGTSSVSCAATVAPPPNSASTSRLSAISAVQSLPRARSAPDVSRAEMLSTSWMTPEPKDDVSLSPMEYIEKLVLRDFLEPMPPK
jgi:hypothetical protein